MIALHGITILKKKRSYTVISIINGGVDTSQNFLDSSDIRRGRDLSCNRQEST